MRITDLLNKESILLGGAPKSKSEAIDMLVELQVKGGNIADKDEYKKGILAREEKGSTAVGEGIAIPHAKSEAVKAPSLAAMTVPEGVDYEALDDEPSNLLFMIAAPNDGDVHLEVLSRLMTILMDEDFREKLLNAKDKDEFLKIIDDMENEKYPDEPKAELKAAEGYKVLAVTACPTGIAHTYMAAEALEKAGKRLGISIKVETNGSGGTKNILTDEEIANCDGIIVAADKTVEMARFDGKKVIRTKVSDGIKIPDELINRIEAGNAPVYHHEGGKGSSSSAAGGDESFGRKLYKHLMNGVSNMLGGMVPPIAIALATTFFKSKFTEDERKNGPVNYIMGLSFITEGAIPYAAADPGRVIPACMIGAGTAGALSMAFGCTLRAPHGGIFVFPVVGNPVMYVLALVIGSVVGMLLLGLFKKKVTK